MNWIKEYKRKRNHLRKQIIKTKDENLRKALEEIYRRNYLYYIED